MSDPHQAPSSLFESLLVDVDFPRDQQFYEYGYTVPDSKEMWLQDYGFGCMENAGTQSDSEVTGAKGEGSWIDDMGQPPMRKAKRGRQSSSRDGEVVSASQLTRSLRAPVVQTRERQRGKNWEKTEEDILVDRKSKDMDWKAISECLQEHGYTRNHKHCADKWYALRKHYLEIHQWMLDNPSIDYWDRSDGERIRSVPPSFCHKWYLIFDAAEKEGRGKPRRKDPGHSLATAAFPSSSDPGSSGAQPSCSLSLPRDEGLQHPAERLNGDAMLKMESSHVDDGLFFAHGALGAYPNQPTLNTIQALVAEINNLSQALLLKFAAEEEERSRHLAIKEKKLELKLQRFEYKRKRDEARQQFQPVAECLNFEC